MPINSGNKKVNNAFDQRAAASDNAQVANLGSRIFNNGGGGAANVPAQRTNNWAPWIQVGLAVAALIWVVSANKKS